MPPSSREEYEQELRDAGVIPATPAPVPAAPDPYSDEAFKKHNDLLVSLDLPTVSREEYESKLAPAPVVAPPAKPDFDEAARREFFLKAFPPPPGYTPAND
jgi:hypothetical protein